MKKVYLLLMSMLLAMFGSGQALNTASEEGRARYEKLQKEQPELFQVKTTVDESQLKSAAIVEVGDTTAVFNYTGSAQEFIVPNGVTQIFIEALGAQGGHGGPFTTGLGGKGGSASGYLDVTPGQILYVYVGGQGQSYTMSAAAGGFNGGGGTNATSDDNKRPGCGGGASDVRTAGNTLADRVIVAGGGGGASGWMDANGGDGGGLEGQEGQPPYWWANFQGLGGTQVAGGAGGNYSNIIAESGGFGFGGRGLGNSHGGGGGGGGWYGGGGGVVDAGGGGSSFIAAVSDSATLAGVNTGDGLIKISWEYVCPDVVVDNDEGLCGALVTYEAPVRGEFVGIQIDASGLTSGDTFPVGVTVQQYEFDYGEGGKDTCTFTVTVNDTEGPVVECSGTGGLGKAAYVSSTAGEPWGQSSNIDAMNLTFGAGNWDHLYYQTVDANTLISGEYSFIYMDGGATNDIPMKTFVETNIGDLEAWVSAGGNLFLNAAPWYTSMNWGFGGVQLNYNGDETSSRHVIATDPSHPIFTGPFTPVVTEYTGTSYSHASIPEQLYTNVLINDYINPAKLVLVSALWGQGKVFFGGMTTTNFHDPELEAFNLRANMLYYLGYNPPLQYSIGEDGTTEISVEDIHSGSSDNCGIDTMFLDKYVFNCDELGPQEVTLSVLDINGNTSTCTATVTIVDDMGPSIKGKSIEVFLNAEGKYTLTREDIATMTAGTIDNCTEAGDLEIGAYPVEFGCIDVGREPAVQLVARDKNGNESKTWVVITVSDTITPAFAPVADVEVVLESGNCDTVAEVEYPEVLVSDNCDVELELLTGLGADAMFPLGATTETWVATDANGNTDTLSFQVIVSVTNNLPTLDTIAGITVDEDSDPLTVTLTGISAGDDCAEQTLTVTAASGNTELISSATVSYSEGGTTGSLELTVAPDKSGEAEITVTVTDSEGGVVTETFMVTVTAVNDAPFVVTPVADQVVNASYVLKVPVPATMFDDIDDDVLTVEVMAEGDTLPGWATLTGDTLVFTPMIADTGCINIIVEATDAAGATAADTFRLCVDGYPVSIGEIGAGTFEVTMYPNPTRGAVNIELQSSGVSEVDLSVVDITGKVVLRRNYSAAERMMFDMSGKVSGMYFVNLKMDGKQIVKKLVVNK